MPKAKRKDSVALFSVERDAKFRCLLDGSEESVSRDLFAFQFDNGKGAQAAQIFYSFVSKELVLGYPRLHKAAMAHALEGKYAQQFVGLLSMSIGGKAVRRAIVAANSDLSLKLSNPMRAFVEAGNGQSLKIASFLLTANIKGQGLQKLGIRGLCAKNVRRMVADLKKKIDALLEESSIINTNVDGIDDIDFFLGEYAKRRFLLDVQGDAKLAGKAQAVYDLLKQIQAEYSEPILGTCKKCAWFSADEENFASLQFVQKGVPCGAKECEFKGRIEEIVDTFAADIGVKPRGAARSGQHETLIFGATHLDARLASVELSSEYGLYPYDLLVIPSAKLLCSDNQLPLSKPNFFKTRSVSSAELWREEMLPFLKSAYKSKKERKAHSHYREESLNRLVGLWIWDDFYETPSKGIPFSEVVAKLSKEDWYKETALGRVSSFQLKRAGKNGVYKKPVYEKHKHYYIITDQGVRHERLLSVRSAKDLARQAPPLRAERIVFHARCWG